MGPFSTAPFQNFQVFPIGLVPKKHSNKFRTIFHLSYPKSGTSSINYFVEKDDFSLQYITIDNAIAVIQEFGRGYYIGKTDIESAFCLIQVNLYYWELLGVLERAVLFSTRRSPLVFALPHDDPQTTLIAHRITPGLPTTPLAKGKKRENSNCEKKFLRC